MKLRNALGLSKRAGRACGSCICQHLLQRSIVIPVEGLDELPSFRNDPDARRQHHQATQQHRRNRPAPTPADRDGLVGQPEAALRTAPRGRTQAGQVVVATRTGRIGPHPPAANPAPHQPHTRGENHEQPRNGDVDRHGQHLPGRYRAPSAPGVRDRRILHAGHVSCDTASAGAPPGPAAARVTSRERRERPRSHRRRHGRGRPCHTLASGPIDPDSKLMRSPADSEPPFATDAGRGTVAPVPKRRRQSCRTIQNGHIADAAHA